MQRGKQQVAGQRSVDGHFRCFIVANFAHHDDIRILSHQRANTGRKCKVNFRPHLRLIDAGNIIFNRIFQRGNIHAFFIQHAQNRKNGG